MQVRKPFAGAFVALLLLAGYLGLAPKHFEIPEYRQSDKLLHFITFFLITLTFYWILDTSRRRVIHLTLGVCTLALGVASEVVQGILPNGRDFDAFDIAANVAGSLAALGVAAWYHQRLIDHKRGNKRYSAVPGDEEAGGDDLPNPDDMELGEQETGVTRNGPDLDDEIDNWDENAEDAWEGEEDDLDATKLDEPTKRID